MSQSGKGGRLLRGGSKKSAERADKVAHPVKGRHKGQRKAVLLREARK